MNKITLLALLLFATLLGQSQVIKKYPVGNSGCSAYMYCEPKFDMSYSEDSSKVYTGECVNGDVTYGVICVKLLSPADDLAMAESVIIAYTDFLKTNFEIKNAVGYGKGNKLNNNDNTTGIVDYWKDSDDASWKIKCWTDGKFIGFLYAHSKKELNETRVNLFLDSFRLP